LAKLTPPEVQPYAENEAFEKLANSLKLNAIVDEQAKAGRIP
jgi:hypothetical protein